MKIYVKYHSPVVEKLGTIRGCWMDLCSSKTYHIDKNKSQLIDLGISMKLPKYFEANIVPRSGSFKNFGLIQLNHMGVVDGADATSGGYSGNGDVWKWSAYALNVASDVKEGERVCQFSIRPSMFAPWYVKLKWLFTSTLKFVEVDDLGNVNRGGFGSTN